METTEYDKFRLTQLVGMRVTGLCQTWLGDDPVIGLIVSDGRTERDVYAFCDPEANGPGHMYVSPTMLPGKGVSV